MAKVKTIRFESKTTINLGNFESQSFTYSEEVALGEKDELDTEREKLIKRVEKTLAIEENDIRLSLKKQR